MEQGVGQRLSYPPIVNNFFGQIIEGFPNWFTLVAGAAGVVIGWWVVLRPWRK